MRASLLYRFFKLILHPSLWVFFERVDVAGREHLPETGPLLVVSNHPNTLMDPILVATQWQRPLSFLAKSPFFKGFVGVIMRAAHAIPLYRKEDVVPVEGAPLASDAAAAEGRGHAMTPPAVPEVTGG